MSLSHLTRTAGSHRELTIVASWANLSNLFIAFVEVGCMISSKTEFLVVASPSHQYLMDITKPLLMVMLIGDSVIPQYIYVQSGCQP